MVGECETNGTISWNISPTIMCHGQNMGSLLLITGDAHPVINMD